MLTRTITVTAAGTDIDAGDPVAIQSGAAFPLWTGPENRRRTALHLMDMLSQLDDRTFTKYGSLQKPSKATKRQTWHRLLALISKETPAMALTAKRYPEL